MEIMDKESENEKRFFVNIMKEVCAEQNIDCVPFSYNWFFKLSKNGRHAFAFGRNFGLNNSTSAKVCSDKCATSDVLLSAGIPAVEHYFYMTPTDQKYVGEDGNWSKLTAFLKKHGKIVCKTNEGSGGRDVYAVENQFELEQAVHRIFQRSRSMAICPFYKIKKEYRAVVLDGEVKLLYGKNIPYIVGDGESTLRALLLRYMEENNCFIDSSIAKVDELSLVLPKGEKFDLGWKSNLKQGATPEIVSDGDLKTELTKLAIDTVNALGVRFVSVDMVETDDGLRVLEVNSGVAMQAFIQSKEENYNIAKQIYGEAINLMLEG